MMKRLSTLALLVATSACSAHLVQPTPATPVVASTTPVAGPPIAVNHTSWSMQLPADWVVDQDDNVATKAHSPTQAIGALPISIIVMGHDMGEMETPEEFAGIVSLMAPRLVPGTATFTKRDMVEFAGVTASMTIIITDAKVGFGIVGVGQASTHLGYVIVCAAPSDQRGAGAACGDALRSFKLK